MAIKNYTSKVPSVQSLAEIQGLLATHGAKKIMLDYDDECKATGITFGISVNGALVGFHITADVDGVMAVFKKQRVTADKDQAERTAWRNVKDWIAAQMAFVECGNAKTEEVFLPYLTDGKTTLYKQFSQGQLPLPEYTGGYLTE